jgi:hypothetical protein
VLSDDATLELRGSAEAVASFQSTPSFELTAPEPRRSVAILGFANLAD